MLAWFSCFSLSYCFELIQPELNRSPDFTLDYRVPPSRNPAAWSFDSRRIQTHGSRGWQTGLSLCGWIKQLRHGAADNSNHCATQKRWYLATSLIHTPPKYRSGNVSSLFEWIPRRLVCLPMLSWRVWVTEYGSWDRSICDFSLQYFLNDICILYIAGIQHEYRCNAKRAESQLSQILIRN